MLFTPQEMEDAKEAYEKKKLEMVALGVPESSIPAFNEKGGIGYDERKDPNPDCPECFGRGRGQVILQDTTKVEGDARRLYGGVEIGKDGLKMKLRSQDKALEIAAKIEKMFDESVVAVSVNTITEQELDAIYEGKVQQAVDKAVQAVERSQKLASKS
jgi:hypothetical protein